MSSSFTQFGEEEEQPEPERDVVLTLEDVNVRFDMSRGVARPVKNIDLEVYRNEILGIAGESGSGKSMLCSTMMDAVEDPGVISGDITFHTSGGREVDVLNLDKASLRRFRWEAIAMVFQGTGSVFNPVLSIEQHFTETMRAHDAYSEERVERMHKLLEDLYLEPERILESYPHELSGGQQQRAMIALSLILDPQILIMDEPTSALDLLMQRSIIDLLREIQDEYEFTLIFITHDLPLIRGLCDRIAIMYAFEIVELGPTQQIMGKAYHPYTRALLNSTPNLDMPVDEMRPIPGEVPDPLNVPIGCSYHPRCPMADNRCMNEDPELNEVDDNHTAACFYTDQIDDHIPLGISAGNTGGRDR